MNQTNFPTTVDVEKLDSLHPDVKKHSDLFVELRLLYYGGQDLKINAARFLAKHSKELGTAYLTRMTRLNYDNILSTICSYYSSRLFENDLEIDWKINDVAKLPEETDSFYKEFLENCDRCGTSLERFFEQVSDEVLVFGRSYFLIDLPKLEVQPTSLYQQMEMGGLSPYLVHIDPRQVYNYQTDAFGNFEWVVIHDKGIQQDFLNEPNIVETWTFYDRQNYAKYQMVWKMDGQRPKEGLLVDSGLHALASENEVPVHCIASNNKLWIGQRIILPLISHLNALNSLDWSLWLSAVALPVFKDGKDEKVAASQTAAEYAAIVIPQDADFKYVEPEGKSFDAQTKYIENLREAIYRQAFLVALGRSSRASATVQSAVSKEQDWQPAASVLNVFGNLIRTAIQDVLEDIAQIREDGTEADVRGMAFSEDNAQQIAELNAIIDSLDIPSPTFKKETRKKLVRSYLRDANADLIQKCVDEIEAAPDEQPEAQPGVAGPQGVEAPAPIVSLNITERGQGQQ